MDGYKNRNGLKGRKEKQKNKERTNKNHVKNERKRSGSVKKKKRN